MCNWYLENEDLWLGAWGKNPVPDLWYIFFLLQESATNSVQVKWSTEGEGAECASHYNGFWLWSALQWLWSSVIIPKGQDIMAGLMMVEWAAVGLTKNWLLMGSKVGYLGWWGCLHGSDSNEMVGSSSELGCFRLWDCGGLNWFIEDGGFEGDSSCGSTYCVDLVAQALGWRLGGDVVCVNTVELSVKCLLVISLIGHH